MAKDWAKPFYNSMEWKLLRRQAMVRDGFTCERCGARATEVHHEIELTPENISDPSISLNLKLLHSLCHHCHTSITQSSQQDCDEAFEFDASGMLVPRRGCKIQGAQKTERHSLL